MSAPDHAATLRKMLEREGGDYGATAEYDALTYALDALADAERLRKRLASQRRELRRLNKTLGPYWRGFQRGLAMEEVVQLRRVMNQAFGHRAVHAAEMAAVAARQQEKGNG